MQVHQADNHLAFALAYSEHIDLPVVLRDSEFLASSEVRSDFRAVNDVLAWETGDVGTGTAHIFSFNDGGLHPLFGQRPGDELAGSSAAQNEEIIVFRF